MRISFKLLGISEAVLIIAIIALLIPMRSEMHRQVVDQIQGELTSIARNAAPLIDGDLHDRMREDSPDGVAAFEFLRERLRAIRDLNALSEEHIYTFHRDGDQVRFAVMTHPTPFIGDPYELRAGMLDVFEDGKVHATDLYEDDHGMWISAYAPIVNAEGAVVGLLEVDKPAEAYFERLHDLSWLVLFSGLIALTISSLIGWRVLDRLVIRPMRTIQAGVIALGEQDFNHRVRLNTGDEFEHLGETLNGISSQLNAAQVVQASFFPDTLPTGDGFRVAGLSVPCDAAGGDYFDAFELDDGRLGLVIADVTGHGLGPSLLMATCRAALRALSTSSLEPGMLVERLNTMLASDLVEGKFITLIYAVLEPNGTLTFANAGHGPAMVIRGGTVEHLPPNTPPLGIIIAPDGDDAQTTISLARGDRILLASDGLPEAMDSEGRHFGAERVEEIARTAPDCETVILELRRELLEHCGGPSRTDDVTILCVDCVHA